jgi:rubrerythrin
MNLEQAITIALEYEGRVHRTYSEAVEEAEHDVARKVFTVLVPKAAIEAGAARLRQRLESGGRAVRGTEFESLKKALDVERETSAFYKKMVATLDDDGRRLFERFVEIEEGHVAIVQAEMDLVSGTGFWFDTAEFSLEKA